MKAIQIMPQHLRRELKMLGDGIRLARRRRRLSQSLMLERTGLSKRTYQEVEKGSPSVAIAAYAMTLFALGLSEGLGRLAAPQNDGAGLLWDIERLPKRIRRIKEDAKEDADNPIVPT